MDPTSVNESVEDLREQSLIPQDQLCEGNSSGTRDCNYVQNSENHNSSSSGISDKLKSALTQHQGRHHPKETFELDETDSQMDPTSANESVEDLSEQSLTPQDQLCEGNSSGTRDCNYGQNSEDRNSSSSGISDKLKSALTQHQGRHHPKETFELDETDSQIDPMSANESVDDLSEQSLSPQDRLHEGNSSGTRACNYVQNSEDHKSSSSEISDKLKSVSTQHQERHHPKAAFLLDETDKVLNTERNVNSRRSRATFICEVCKTVFFNRLGLRIHVVKIHSEIRSYGCEMCEEKFYTKYDLDAHSNVHKCECKMSEKHVCKKHSLYVNMSVPKHECGKCGAQFDKKCDLDLHMIVHVYKCKICKKILYTKYDFKAHMSVNKYKCKVCKKMFCNKYDLDFHESFNRYECKECKKMFCNIYDLHLHMIVHFGTES